MTPSWESMVRRAKVLAAGYPESTALMTFYAGLLETQKEIYDYLRSRKRWQPSGRIESDLPAFRSRMKMFVSVVESTGPDLLKQNAGELRKAPDKDVDDMLIDQWHHPVDLQFFAKAFLQPYARLLAELNIKPQERSIGSGENRCRFCDGKAQVAYLRSEENEGGGRHLVCSTCLSSWQFRRLVCPNCGEEDPKNLAYYNSPTYEHIRVETCEACKNYIKCVDLTKLGLAVPIVDEVAAAALDVWARDKGYTKIELNLVGL